MVTVASERNGEPPFGRVEGKVGGKETDSPGMDPALSALRQERETYLAVGPSPPPPHLAVSDIKNISRQIGARLSALEHSKELPLKIAISI